MHSAPFPSSRPDAHPVAALDHLVTDLGLAAHPEVAGAWDELRHPSTWDTPAPAEGLPHGPRLVRLGQVLTRLRPARCADIFAVFRTVSIPPHRLVCRVVHVRVSVAASGGLVATAPHAQCAAEAAPIPSSPVARSLAAVHRATAETASLVVVLHLEHLSPAHRAAADDLPWEDLLAPYAPGWAHLVRCVPAPAAPTVRPPLAAVGFLGAPGLASAVAEEQALRDTWHQRVRVGVPEADVVHVHAHGAVGAVHAVDLHAVRASVAVFNACEGALLGGVVRAVVTEGHVLDSFGFAQPVLTESGRILTRSLHPHLYTWRDDSRAGAVWAALAARQALGRRSAASFWRHYRAVGPVPPSRPDP